MTSEAPANPADPANPAAPTGTGTGSRLDRFRTPRAIYWGMVAMIVASGLTGGLGAPLVISIARSEGVDLAVAQWSVTSALLVAAVAAPVVGRLGGGGRQRIVLIVLMSLASIGTLMAALPLGIESLIAGRALQGLSIAAQPLMMAVGRDALSPEREVEGVSTLSAAIVVSAGLGFPTAAILGQGVGVHGAFWFGVVLLVACLVIAVLVVPPPRVSTPGSRPRFDLFGAVLMGSGTLMLLLAISQSRTWGYLSVSVLVLGGAGLLALIWTGWWMLRTSDPLVDLRLVKDPVVLACHVAGLLCGMGMYMLLTLTLVLGQGTGFQHGLGMSVALAGLLMLPYSVLSVIGNKAGLRMSRVVDVRWVLPIGCAIFAAALIMLAFWHHSPTQLFLAMTLGGLGSGLSFTSIPGLMMKVVPPAELASALSFNVVLRFVGFSTGSVVSVALLEVVDGHRVTHTGALLASSVAGLSCLIAALLAWVLLLRPTSPVKEN